MRRRLTITLSLLLLAAQAVLAQTSRPASPDRQIYQVDLPSASRIFAGESGASVLDKNIAVGNLQLPQAQPPAFQFSKPEELFQASVKVEGDSPLIARTHLFGARINVIPYSDDDDVVDAAANKVLRGDAAIAAYFPPGQVGFAIKHHRPIHRELTLDGDVEKLREDVKLQDTHISIVIGVMRDGMPGAITANSPQDYLDGKFGQADYPMIFVRPRFPSFVNEANRKLLMENLRTMVLGFNAVAVFPDEYNGGDPLGARDPKAVREHVAMMIRGIAGEQAAKDYFADPSHKIYCAELAFIAASASMLVPLNDTAALAVLQEFGDSPARARQLWTKFQTELTEHNNGRESTFDTMNENPMVKYVQLANAASLASLKPMLEYADDKARSNLNGQLAFPPMTISDIIESFLKSYVPRQQLGEKFAPVQAALLQQVKPGLIHVAEAEKGSEAAKKLEELLDKIIDVCGRSYENYDQFRAALAPLLEIGRKMTGPRPGEEQGLYVPPTLFHLVARGDLPAGLLGLDYVGHGLHYSIVRPVNVTP